MEQMYRQIATEVFDGFWMSFCKSTALAVQTAEPGRSFLGVGGVGNTRWLVLTANLTESRLTWELSL